MCISTSLWLVQASYTVFWGTPGTCHVAQVQYTVYASDMAQFADVTCQKNGDMSCLLIPHCMITIRTERWQHHQQDVE